MSSRNSGHLPAVGGKFFQLGYVAHDLDRAMKAFAARGVTRFNHFMSQPGFDVALAYTGDTMIEIIAVSGEIHPTYADAFAQGELVLHHLGYLVDAETFERAPATLEALDIPIGRRGGSPGGVGFIYADTRREFGHYSEYVYVPDDSAFLANVPRN